MSVAAAWEPSGALPPIVTVAVEFTLNVLTVKVALVAPAGIVTLAGTVARLVFPLESVMTTPPAGAAALSVTVPVVERPPRILDGLSVSELNVAPLPPPPPTGINVNVAVFVTPAAVAEIVTTVCVVTGTTLTKNPPAMAPCGIVTPLGTVAAGSLLESAMVVSVVAGDASRTVPFKLPLPVTVVWLSVSESGGCAGVSVTCAWSVVPPCVAVIVTSVFAVTALVGRPIERDGDPAATVTVAGGLAAGESLARFTMRPPSGAFPFNITINCGSAPPVIVLGESVSDFNAGGFAVKLTEAEVPLSDAVSVTCSATVTDPIWKRN